MNLTSGTKLGPYEIVAHSVRAAWERDTRFDRAMEIKILPASFLLFDDCSRVTGKPGSYPEPGVGF